MRIGPSSFAATALLAGFLACPSGRAEAQAVAFYPSVGTIPDGVGLNVTPVVSADRRYVRLSLDVNFSTINGFNSFPVPGAVSGGNGSGGFRGGLGGLGGGAGGNAGGPGGFRNVMGGPGLADSGVPYNLEYLAASREADRRAKAEPAKPNAPRKKALADPVMVPSKKKKA